MNTVTTQDQHAINHVVKRTGCTEDQALAALVAEDWSIDGALRLLRGWVNTYYVYNPISGGSAGGVYELVARCTEISIDVVRDLYPNSITLPESRGQLITVETHQLTA
jgi:hypothetical protein